MIRDVAPLEPPSSPNFAFLSDISPTLLTVLTRAEWYYREDPVTCLFRLRQFAEMFSREVLQRRGGPPSGGLKENLVLLEERRLLPSHLYAAIDRIRSDGNDAVHQQGGEHSVAAARLKDAHDLAKWFHKTFGGRSIAYSAFVVPEVPSDAFDIAESWSEAEALRKRFAPRPHVLAWIHDWLEKAAAGGALLIVAPPGQGKSAVMAKLAEEMLAGADRGARGGWVCALHMGKSNGDPRRILQSWIRQIAIALDLPASYEVYAGDVAALRNRLVGHARQAIARGHRVCLLLDAFDELNADGRRADFLPANLPEGVRVVVTCRPISEQIARIRSRMQSAEVRELEPVDETDIRGFAELYLEPTLAARVEAALGWSPFLTRTGGSALLLRRAFENIASVCRPDAEELTSILSAIPESADEVFESVFDELAGGQASMPGLVLQALATARDALSTHDLTALLGCYGEACSPEEVARFLKTADAYLVRQGGRRFRLYHQGFGEFVRRSVLADEGCLRWHHVFVKWLDAAGANSVYRLEFLAEHLLAASDLADDGVPITEFAALALSEWSFVEGVTRAGLVASYRRQLEEVARRLKEGDMHISIRALCRFIDGNEVRVRGEANLLVQYALDDENVRSLVSSATGSQRIMRRIGPAPQRHPNLLGAVSVPEPPVAIQFSPSGKSCVAFFQDGPALVWDTETWLCSHRFPIGGSTSGAWLDDETVISADWEGGFSIWSCETGKLVKRAGDPDDRVSGVVVLTEGRHVAGISENAVKMWDLETGTSLTLHTVPGDDGDPQGVYDFALNSSMMCAVSVDGGVSLGLEFFRAFLQAVLEERPPFHLVAMDKAMLERMIEWVDAEGDDFWLAGDYALVTATDDHWFTLESGFRLTRHGWLGHEEGTIELYQYDLQAMHLGSGGHLLLVGSDVLLVDTVDMAIAAAIPQARSRFTPSTAAISPDGSVAVLATDGGVVELWSTDATSEGTGARALITRLVGGRNMWAYERFFPGDEQVQVHLGYFDGSSVIDHELTDVRRVIAVVPGSDEPELIAEERASGYATVGARSGRRVPLAVPKRETLVKADQAEDEEGSRPRRRPTNLEGRISAVSPTGAYGLLSYPVDVYRYHYYRWRMDGTGEPERVSGEGSEYDPWDIDDDGAVATAFRSERARWLRVVQAGQEEKRIRTASAGTAVCLLHEGVAFGHEDGSVGVRSRQLDLKATLSGPLGGRGRWNRIDALAVSPDSRYLAAASRSGLLRVWDLETYELRYSFEDRVALFACSFVGPDQIAFAGAANHCHFMRLEG